MANKSLNSPSFHRFSRMGFGLRIKSQSASPSPRIRDSAKSNQDSDWYIPYNGPYEPPRDTYVRGKEPLRDSWGDPVVDAQAENDEENPIFSDAELHTRYENWNPADERKGRPRARTQSSSSGTVDPSRASMATGRRSTVSHVGNPPPVPSYISLSGGVGESPVPKPRAVRETGSSKRRSLASLFTFNSTSRKLSSSSKAERQHTSNIDTPSRLSDQGLHSVGFSKLPETPHLPSVAAVELFGASAATGDEEYYNSYYSSLINQPQNNHQTARQPPDTSFQHTLQQPSSPQSPPHSGPSSATHPYAYAYSTSTPSAAETPRSAPPPKTHFERTPIHYLYPEKSRVVSPAQILKSKSIPQTKPHLPGHTLSLKNSISSPDLRSNNRSKSLIPRGKDRWLSAETWCDALLFPRPRFRLKQDKDASASNHAGSGRIVSPPGSPVLGHFSNANAAKPSITSRVLAHSRSMVDLSKPIVVEPSTLPRIEAHPPPDPLQIARPSEQASFPSRAPRPKSWALDDLALPSPAPSLARVLEEGQILEHQRKKWQAQAVNSFQNHRARSLSRTRTKSLSSKQPKRKDNSKLDFLAARGLLGDQNIIPVNVVKPRQRSDSQTESRGTTVGQISSHHHHTSSLSKTLTKSSNKTHSRNHSRTESIGRSAVRMVKNTANHLCAFDGEGVSPAEEKMAGLEGALQNNATKVISFADPAQIYIESPLPSRNGDSVSPTPSGISDSRMGIALTTPPMTEENFEPIRMPAHPYAQGGFSFLTPHIDFQSNARVDLPLAQAKPSQESRIQNPIPVLTSWHPYAQAGSSARDSYQSEMKITPRLRSDSDVPPPQKMWAQWSSGVVQEILPTELQYSPYLHDQKSMVEDDSQVRKQVRNSSPIYNTAGVGEALAFAAMQRYSRDSGIGTSEEHASAQAEYEAGSISSNRYRKTTQYDVTRPLYLQKTVVSSPLQAVIIPTPTPPLEMLRQESSNSGGNHSSDSSPPMSPPPPLGNVDDLATFHDLFYRPNISRNVSNDGAPARINGIPWDVASAGQRGSGLTSIARQLTEELSESRDSLKNSISFRSQSSLSALRQSLYEARTPPADANMRFVFSDLPETASLNTNGERKNLQANILTFEPSVQISEDAELSRASSPTRSPVDKDDDLDTDEFRVGQIESNITPLAISGVSRVSLTGQMAFAIGDAALSEQHNDEDVPPSTAHLTTAHSSLQPPSAGLTRSSYMTTSDGSRMSGLSDFPDPPPQRLTPAHMSLLSSYFDNTITEKEIADVRAYGHVKPATRSRSGSVLTSRPEAQGSRPPIDVPDKQEGVSFDGNEEIDNLIASLSPSSRS
ncbi:hypothetical protein F5876DRAFT_74133 [Lentinula aff. lateritia]|uniref:Uncharacterized protein n=1 Tax=Lentinula aff. lateritia TaxID=2804960 RepID=A0ACC1U8A8_9AGAR|nr:hypothetical protein F5876DRAFT_74133 [Lentinula aff. lateritia]